jgi:hypothetical protein
MNKPNAKAAQNSSIVRLQAILRIWLDQAGSKSRAMQSTSQQALPPRIKKATTCIRFDDNAMRMLSSKRRFSVLLRSQQPVSQ